MLNNPLFKSQCFRPNCEVQNLKCQMRHSVWIYNPFIEIFDYDFFRISYCSADATYDHIFKSSGKVIVSSETSKSGRQQCTMQVPNSDPAWEAGEPL